MAQIDNNSKFSLSGAQGFGNSGNLPLSDLPKIAAGLNIEGYRPTLSLPPNCKWYNIVQVIDEPLQGETFDAVMAKVRDHNYPYIEEAVGINIPIFLHQLATFIKAVAKNHTNILIHVHQYTGTTILDKTLQKLTGIKTILDQTNYFDCPIIYSEDYPTIDALISISQCAGFGYPAGTWIVPTKFMEFDVTNGIIYTNPIQVQNWASDIFDFDHVKGTILIVNDLWNPLVDPHGQILGSPLDTNLLLFDQLDRKTFEFVKASTEVFGSDDTHNWKHALKVARNSTLIRNTKEVLYLGLNHDVCDHKYPQSIPRSELTNFIQSVLPMYQAIDTKIERISYSKQLKEPDTISDPDIDAVRDGDRIEALGPIGIYRCETLTRLRGGKVPDDVIVHCYDKLLRLLPDKFIVTPVGRSLALPLHNHIVQYVRTNLPLTQLTYELPEFLTADDI